MHNVALEVRYSLDDLQTMSVDVFHSSNTGRSITGCMVRPMPPLPLALPSAWRAAAKKDAHPFAKVAPVSMCQTLFGEGEESQTQWYAEGNTACKEGSSLLLTYSEQDQVLSGEDLSKEQLC